MSASNTRLIYAASVKRGRFGRQFLLGLLGALTSVGAYAALREAGLRPEIDVPPLALDIGKLAAIILGGWLAVRSLIGLWRALTRPSQAVRVYNKGFAWEKGGVKNRYRWQQLLTFREGARGIFLGGRPLLQWGAHELTMDDRQVLRFTADMGNTRAFADAVRPYTSYVTSVRIGRLLRQNQSVKLHPKLTVTPSGVEAGKTEVTWADMDIQASRSGLSLRKRSPQGKFKTVRHYPLHALENAGGFLELAQGTIRNYQPESYKQPQRSPRRETSPLAEGGDTPPFA
jgi:hypothetical protein